MLYGILIKIPHTQAFKKEREEIERGKSRCQSKLPLEERVENDEDEKGGLLGMNERFSKTEREKIEGERRREGERNCLTLITDNHR